MHSAQPRLYPEGISPHRVVYTVILSSLIALLLPSIFGVLHLIKDIRHDERAQGGVENAMRFVVLLPSSFQSRAARAQDLRYKSKPYGSISM